MKPYKAEPVLLEKIWGGNRLSGYNKKVNGETIGESWETGALEGSYPVLIKLIDAKETLSVQVHPDDEFAQRFENAQNGKNEAWIVLECEENAFIIYGFRRTVKKEELKELLKENLISDVLNYVKVKKGDCIYIPAGTVHSLGKGVLVYEVQQPSDLTYRIYDWDRRDSRGKSRELHIDKAVEAINYSAELPRITNIYQSSQKEQLNIIDCEYFKSSYRILENREHHKYDAGRFKTVTMVSGSAALAFENVRIPMQKGDTCIVPEEYRNPISIEGLENAEYIVTACNLQNML